MLTIPDFKAIKTDAKLQFKGVPGITGFGLGDKTLRIYVTNQKVREALPDVYQGVPVEFVVTGNITAAAVAHV